MTWILTCSYFQITCTNIFFSFFRYGWRGCQQPSWRLEDHCQPDPGRQGPVIVPTTLLRRGWPLGEGILFGQARNPISNHLVLRWWIEGLGSCVSGGGRRSYHPLCRRHPALHPPHGLHWQFHRLLPILHLALHFPLSSPKTHYEYHGHGLRHFHHSPWRHFWPSRHVLFCQSPTKGLCAWSARLKRPKSFKWDLNLLNT